MERAEWVYGGAGGAECSGDGGVFGVFGGGGVVGRGWVVGGGKVEGGKGGWWVGGCGVFVWVWVECDDGQ